MYDTSILSGTVHSNRTVAVVLHKQNTPYFRLLAFKFPYTLSTFFNSSSIITNCMYSTTRPSNITANVNTQFIFFKSAYYV